LFNKSDRAKREGENKGDGIIYSSTIQSSNNGYKDNTKNLELDRYKWWWMTHGITSTLISQRERERERQKEKNDGIEI